MKEYVTSGLVSPVSSEIIEHSRSTAELDRSLPPLGVLNVLLDLVHAEFECDDPDGIGVRLAEHGPQAGNLLSRLEVDLLRVDLDIFLDPLVRLALDLLEVGRRDGRLVRKVESELRRRDERTFLINVVAEDFPQAVVEDVGTRVVVAKGPSSELAMRADMVNSLARRN